MGIITTGIITSSLILINFGFTRNFFLIWIKSWIFAYIIVIPVIIFIAPVIQNFVDSIFDKK